MMGLKKIILWLIMAGGMYRLFYFQFQNEILSSIAFGIVFLTLSLVSLATNKNDKNERDNFRSINVMVYH